MPETAIQRPLHPSNRQNRRPACPYILFKPGHAEGVIGGDQPKAKKLEYYVVDRA